MIRLPACCAWPIALTHHERWDGHGNRYGLAGEEIPLMGRICSLADAFDALTSQRPYKKPWSVEASIHEIQRCSGAAFDVTLVGMFVEILPEIVKIREAFADTGQPHLIALYTNWLMGETRNDYHSYCGRRSWDADFS